MNIQLIAVLGVTIIGIVFRKLWPARLLAVVALLYVAVTFQADVQALQRTAKMAIEDLKEGTDIQNVEQILESGLHHSNRVHHPAGLVTVVCLGLLALIPTGARLERGQGIRSQ